MGKFNKMINFVKSSYKRTAKRINYIGHLAVTEPTCGPDSKFPIYFCSFIAFLWIVIFIMKYTL